MMITTLHVDLEWTDLADFTEHFEGMLRTRAFGMGYLLGVEGHGMYWGHEPYERPATEWGNPALPAKYWRVLADDAGNIGRYWWIMAGEAKATGDKQRLAQEESFHAFVEAVRYRRDRLKLVIAEAGEDLGYGARILQWLEERWEDAVIRKDEATAPVSDPQEPMPPLPSRARSEDWERWFDWYYRQPGRPSIEDMAQKNGKAESTIEKKHAEYWTSRR